jgi:EAL and modified HD-GYP domain-containing signal transduction protein
MEILVARQPIYDRNLKVIAYELLYRSNSKVNAYIETDGDLATAAIIMEAFLDGEIETMTDGKLGFINFSDNFLKSDVVKLLPTKYLGIEILETVEPTDEMLNTCAELNSLGYTIVLDDYIYTEATKRFIPYAKIIKLDFLSSTDTQLQTIVQEYKNQGIKFLAEKIETKEAFIKARSYGYSYFQGYYFCRPALIENKVLLPLQVSALQVLQMLQDDNCNLNKIAEIISYDPGIMYKLFRLANSIIYGGRSEIKEVNVALARIGLKELRTWMLFVLMHGMHEEKPNELIRQSMLRARVAEEIYRKKNLIGSASDFSLLGLFSLLDAIMDVSLDVILSSIKINKRVKSALVSPDNDAYGAVIKIIRAYDEADWDEAEKAGDIINLSIEEYGKIYLNAVKWCDARYRSLYAKR